MKKLGKGLEDISHLFLSTAPAAAIPAPSSTKEPATQFSHKILCVLTDTAQAASVFLVTNLCLTLAKLGIKTALIDCDQNLPCFEYIQAQPPPDSSRISSSLLQSGQSGLRVIAFVPELIRHWATQAEYGDFLVEVDQCLRDCTLVVLSMSRRQALSLAGPAALFIDELLVPLVPAKEHLLDAYQAIKSWVAVNPLLAVGAIVCEIDYMYQIEPTVEHMARVMQKFLSKQLYKYGFMFRLAADAKAATGSAAFFNEDVMACIANIAQILVLRMNGVPAPTRDDSICRGLARVLTENRS